MAFIPRSLGAAAADPKTFEEAGELAAAEVSKLSTENPLGAPGTGGAGGADAPAVAPLKLSIEGKDEEFTPQSLTEAVTGYRTLKTEIESLKPAREAWELFQKDKKAFVSRYAPEAVQPPVETKPPTPPPTKDEDLDGLDPEDPRDRKTIDLLKWKREREAEAQKTQAEKEVDRRQADLEAELKDIQAIDPSVNVPALVDYATTKGIESLWKAWGGFRATEAAKALRESAATEAVKNFQESLKTKAAFGVEPGSRGGSATPPAKVPTSMEEAAELAKEVIARTA